MSEYDRIMSSIADQVDSMWAESEWVKNQPKPAKREMKRSAQQTTKHAPPPQHLAIYPKNSIRD